MGEGIEKGKIKILNYILTVIVLSISILLILWIWAPTVFFSIINWFVVPSRVVALNLMITSIIPLLISLFVCLLLLFIIAWKKKVSVLYWINGLSTSIIISHLIMLVCAFL